MPYTPLAGKIGHLVSLILSLLAISLGLATLLAFAARLSWVLDLFTHFRAQYALLALALAVLSVAAGSVPAALVSAVVALMNLPVLLSLVGGRSGAEAPSDGPAPTGQKLKVTTLNLYRRNPNREKVIDFLRNRGADLLIVQEANRQWHQHLRALEQLYPFSAPSHAWLSSSTLVFSRHPVVAAKHVAVADSHSSLLVVEVSWAGQRLVVMPVHLESPMSATQTRSRNLHLEAIAKHAKSITGPLVVAGDFNATPWSPSFAKLLGAAGLSGKSGGRRWIATWPTFLPFLAIPIDHVLANRELAIVEAARGPKLGSDHWPLTATLQRRRFSQVDE